MPLLMGATTLTRRVHTIGTPAELAAYEAWIQTHPHGSLWQSLAWKKYQEALGREVRIYVYGDFEATALVVIDETSLGFSTWDIPRGPLWRDTRHETLDLRILSHIAEEAQNKRCVTLYFSPPVSCPLHPTTYTLQPSTRSEQPECTRIIDLTKSDEEILSGMHQKGRYNIHLAERHGVGVERIEKLSKPDILDFALDSLYRLILETGRRDSFTPLPKAHYEAFLKHLEGSFLLLAYSPSPAPSPIAGLMGVVWRNVGYFYYGASNYTHRHLMAPYLLQWEAMKLCKELTCTTYDLLGVCVDAASSTHPWRGISTFKEKFGGSLTVYPKEQEMLLRPMAATLLKLKRRVVG